MPDFKIHPNFARVFRRLANSGSDHAGGEPKSFVCLVTAAQRLEDVVNPFFNKLIAVIKQKATTVPTTASAVKSGIT